MVVLRGNLGQLHPARANSPWKGACQVNDLPSWSSYKDFTVVIKLTENKRLDNTDPSESIFDQFLDRLCGSESAEEDWNALREK